MHKWPLWLTLWVAFVSAACATTAPVSEPPVITWDEKLEWIVRLEDLRIVRDPNPPPAVVLAPATSNRPAIVAPPPPSDLIRLLADDEARVRRRAALALGRVGLPEAVAPLTTLLADDEPEVRQMAAFALGLVGDPVVRPQLAEALVDPDARVQGRAAEALGMIGDPADAMAVSVMVQRQVNVGAFADIDPDDVSHPLAAPVEAARLGLFALVRFGSYDALAAAVLATNGQPLSHWWPVSYALQRLGDPRAATALLTLLNVPGRYTAAFAARGLGVAKADGAAGALSEIIDRPGTHAAVVIQAIRALAALGDSAAAPALTDIIAGADADPVIRVEAVTALGAVASPDSLDVLLDLLSDPAPPVRGTAMQALARLDPVSFLGALSGLDPDRDWTVRRAQATALGTLAAEQGFPRLQVMLDDVDRRVVPAVLAAVVASQAPGAETILLEHLEADDYAVRSAAATGLAELKVASAVQPLIEAYRAALGDSTYDARAAVLAALTQIDPAAARPLLEEALADREWAVRVRAATLLRDLGADESVAEAIRPATGGRSITADEWASLMNPPYSPHAFIETDRGVIEIELAVLDAPLTVANFIALARRGFFDGTAIHRVVPDFVVQDGDPRGDGTGGPGYTIRDEINQTPYLRGTVGMALDWEDTGGSQFFITHSPQPHLDGRYTVFGHVVDGLEVLDRTLQFDVIRRVRIWDGVTADP